MDFKTILLLWYSANKRDLPWRRTANPYKIWISEVILQQTRVIQGLDYYHRFIEAFPTVRDLAHAQEDGVLKLWQGLGYYSRARYLLEAAKYVENELDGVFPSTYKELLKLKGVGDYSAGAIASFAFNEPVPAIDGNVFRVISRIFGVFESPFTASGKRVFRDLVMELMDKSSPHEFNQALLDFGALQCVPRSPKCLECPFASWCYAYRNNVIDALPIKQKKIKVRNRYFVYLLIRHKDYTFINRRSSKDIWKSLYDFPLIESERPIPSHKIHETEEWKVLFDSTEPEILHISPKIKHLLSHQLIYTRFVIVNIEKESPKLLKDYIKVLTDELETYSVPTLIDNFLTAEPSATYFLNSPYGNNRG